MTQLDLMNVIYKKVSNALGVKNYSDRLIHYTSCNSLKAIIDSQQLWFGRIDEQNDESEYDYFLDVLKKSESPYYADMLVSIASKESFSRDEARINTFISSWCEYSVLKPNGSLNMMRIYGGSSSIGIVIDSSQFQPLDVAGLKLKFPVNTALVDYWPRKQIPEHVASLVDRVKQAELPLPEDAFVMMFQAMMYAKAPCVKVEDFSEERDKIFTHSIHTLSLGYISRQYREWLHWCGNTKFL
jgi:hypothetical protein